VGQAKRLAITSMLDGERPVVQAIDPLSRRVVVGPRGEGTCAVQVGEVNWLVDPPPGGFACEVKLRAREAPHRAWVEPTEAGAVVRLERPALPAPGQACVFYDGTRVLGGGFIRRPAVDAAGASALFAVSS
jgi:tRNA-uridine 2-sulfurtransferase